MMTPKEALLKDGTIPVKGGRGRLSREAIERCKYLVANGWKIKGYDSAPSKSTAEPVEVKRVPATNVKVVSDFVIFYERDSYRAVTPSGKVYGMAEVCNNCRVSLVQCHCGNPTILGDISVRITPNK